MKQALEFVPTEANGKSLRARMLQMMAVTAMLAIAIASTPSHAISQGVSNATLKPGSTGGGCTSCHNPQGGSIASVTIAGPATLDAGATGTYTVTATQVTPAAGVRMGLNVAASNGTLSNATGQQTQVVNEEITHKAPSTTLPVTTASGTASYNFAYTMPGNAASGSTHTLYATASLGPGEPQAGARGWQHAANFTVTTGAAQTNPPRLANISTRMQVLTGNDVMIAGFVIGGSANKTVAIVATGPSLAAFGIANPLANPMVTLVRSSDQATLATNDDWTTAGNASQLQQAGFAPTNGLEAAILINLPPGAYTAIVQGVNNGTGTAVAAVYEVDALSIPLTNISTRGRVQTGQDVMIGGFVIQGSGPQNVAIVATGPSLAAFGIANPLANPTLQLVRSSDQAVLATNDDWGQAPNAAQIQAAGFAPTNTLESAIMMSLPPGAYTAVLSGVNNGTGVGVIGVYKAP